MISAIVLAAGRSIRMGRPKMLLPWGETSVIGRVVSVLAQAEIDDILVVTGGAGRQVEKALRRAPLPRRVLLRTVHNADYAQGEMLSSFQVGLSALGSETEACLIALGDQPQIEAGVVQAILEAFRASGSGLVIPSYQMRRGHPWLIHRSLWPAVLALRAPQTLRDFLGSCEEQIQYVVVESASILQDLDTPEDYQRYSPPGSNPRN